MFSKVICRSIRNKRLITWFYNYNKNIFNNFPNETSPNLRKHLYTNNLTYNCMPAKLQNSIQEENINSLTEKEYLVKIKNDPDIFGSGAHDEQEADPGDLLEEKFLQEKPDKSQKLRTKQYADIIKAFLRNRKIKEAIDVLEVRMLKEDGVKPENYIYNLIIGACGRVGYTKKAFSLYNEMKRRALKITPGTYTALFNACANSPWPSTDGLTRASHLRGIMIEKMYEPNKTNYNAMIKAFGRGGDLQTSFALVDEMKAKKFIIKDDTLNFLLQACISDREAGFRHALLVWRKFIDNNVAPSLFSYNLILKCIRHCGLGDIETTTDVINRLLPENKQFLESNEAIRKLIDHKSANQDKLTEYKNEIMLNKPNLMAKVPHLGNILALSEITNPEDRLLLVGGYSGFLKSMLENDCAPDIKTFTQLLDSIPSTTIAEKELMQTFRKNNVKPDLDFFNMLIKKRSSRFEYESAKEVLTMIKTANYRPNLITYGVLAIGCKTKDEALSLLEEMSNASYRINIEILGAMLTQACHHVNFPYVLLLMETCVNEEIKVGQKFLENLEGFKKNCKAISNDSKDPLAKSRAFQKGFQIFRMKYKTWLEEVQKEDTDVHPWQQYRQTSDTNVRHYKDKEMRTRFKPVHTSLYRQKTKRKM